MNQNIKNIKKSIKENIIVYLKCTIGLLIILVMVTRPYFGDIAIAKYINMLFLALTILSVFILTVVTAGIIVSDLKKNKYYKSTLEK